MDQKRVKFDFAIAFTNGGGLQGQDFRLDIDGDDIADEALASYLIRDLRLLMVGEVRILNKQVITEPHKRVPPAPADLSTALIDLRTTPTTLQALLARAAQGSIRVVAPDGDSYLIRRAAE
ncbi:MAG TPA: hypothetical protein VLK84_30315 [Longimicrobium sp.]|nr:hypothetical protein [Longimicrobium sp.]